MRRLFDLIFKRNRNQQRRLSATIETLELEIKTSNNPYGADILHEAKKSLASYDYDAAWKKIHLLKRELVGRLSADEIMLKSIALKEEANDKLEGWRRAAIQEVLQGDATKEKLQHAMSIMDEHFDNLFHKTSLARGHVILLLLVLMLKVAAILVFKQAFFVQELSEEFSIQMIFPAMLFGAIGSTFSGVISVAKATKVKIPEQKANFFYQLIRVLLGAVTGLIIYFIITAQITDVLNVEASQFERVLIYCFIAGFSEDYLLMLVDKAKK